MLYGGRNIEPASAADGWREVAGMQGSAEPEKVDGEILASLAQIDDLRTRGMTPEQIAAAMASSGAPVPGGDRWSEAMVARIIQIFDSVRDETGADGEEAPQAPQAPQFPQASQIPSAPELPQVPQVPQVPQIPRASRAHPAPDVPDGRAPTRPQPVVELAEDGRSGGGLGPLALVRWLATGAVLAGIGAGGFLAIQAVVDRRDPSSDVVGDVAAPTTVPSTETTVVTEPPNPADTMAIRIEPADPDRSAGPDGLVAATATIRNDGKLYLEGAFASQEDADAFLDNAGAIFGRENIVESYVVDPSAPAPTVSDVALDKPVLFESGTAEIDPDYIPFLEACAGVLAANPHIVMSISAYTDSIGPEEFNLELSQSRAQAIVDFYREREIGGDQLIGTGLGEADPVADNSTEAGRSDNRRAMLQLLNVMDDEADAVTG